MAAKKITKKSAPKSAPKKKFEFTRAQVAEKLEALSTQLSDLDVAETTPNQLEELLSSIRDDLDDVSYELTEVKYEPGLSW